MMNMGEEYGLWMVIKMDGMGYGFSMGFETWEI